MSPEPQSSSIEREIAEQPQVIARLLERAAPDVAALAEAVLQRLPRVVVLVARGSSDNAAIYGRYLLEICAGRLTSLAAPSTLTLYERAPDLRETLVVGVSQSGRGEDVVSYLHEARRQGAMTVAIVNDVDSPLAAEAEWVFDCHAGPEISVPATKTVTAQMTLLAMLTRALAQEGGQGSERDWVTPLRPLPHAIERALECRPTAHMLASELVKARAVAVLGRGFAFPAALEIGLKLKETAALHAEPFSTADYYHGPITLVDEGYAVLLVDVGGRAGPTANAARQEIQRRGGTTFVIRADGLTSRLDDCGHNLQVDVPLDEPIAPIVAVVLGQLLAVEAAYALGMDPSRPRGLLKVTSTR